MAKRKIKKEFKPEFCKIQKIKNSSQLINLLTRHYSTIVHTYNKIMENTTQIEYIFVSNVDTIIVHHLIMFCEHFNIKLYQIDRFKDKVCGVYCNKEVKQFIENDAIVVECNIYDKLIVD